MKKSAEDIQSAVQAPATGISLVLLSIVGFIVSLWIIITLVRVVMG